MAALKLAPIPPQLIAQAITALGIHVGILAILLESENRSARNWANIAVSSLPVDPQRTPLWIQSALEHHGAIREDEEGIEAAGLRFLADPHCMKCGGQGRVGVEAEFRGDNNFVGCECTEGKCA